ncbi:DUF177 domain-containing protein [Kaustia mangrovi]|uniref:DUF177 domain-containing protein n=1 Tax=Kaustia mangrovi TaxID=2593653 RepID=A0A7S8C7S2_9HYPH|nr:DUF177 domain-containing protein [Kaustia mangrovi]QPC44917.1 DUF177 domain-containing protein [Kaustia mangrovi]
MPGTQTVEFSRPLSVEEVPVEGQEVALEADEEERAALAGRLGLDGLKSLTAYLKVDGWQSGGLHVSGSLAAEAEQTCVVTLDPVERRYEETVERYYLPAGSLVEEDGEEAVVDAESGEEPDVIAGGHIDLGELVAETLALVIDPYPRKPGASVAEIYPDLAGADGEDTGKKNPFAVLERLKKEMPSGGAKE